MQYAIDILNNELLNLELKILTIYNAIEEGYKMESNIIIWRKNKSELTKAIALLCGYKNNYVE